MTKLFNIFILIIAFTALNSDSKASEFSYGGTGDTLTVKFKVNGTTACKSNIESVLSGKTGIVSGLWNATTKEITIKYIDTEVQQVSDLHTLFALAGYDTSDIRAKQGAYDALPADCKYTRDQDTE